MTKPTASALPVLLTLALACTALAQLPPEGSFGPEAFEARQDGVPVRSEPGFLFREIRTLEAGEEVLVDQRKGQWLHVRPTGWIFVDHVVRRGAAPAEGARTMVVARDNARVRQGPGTGFPVVAQLVAGAEVSVVGEQDGWVQLASGGYLFKDLVAEPRRADPAAAGAGEWVVVASSANARSGPATDKPVVAQYQAGQRVPVARIVDGWCEVAGVGFIRQDLLAPPAPEAPRRAATAPAAGPGPGQPEKLKRWTLMDLHGTSFEVREIDPRSDLLALLRRELRSTGVMEDDWTIMSLGIGVPEDSAYRFNYDPDTNAAVVIDAEGARYGNVYVRGTLDRLPAHVRQLLSPVTVEQGKIYEGILLFRPTLKTREIREVWMTVGGRLQQMYEAP